MYKINECDIYKYQKRNNNNNNNNNNKNNNNNNNKNNNNKNNDNIDWSFNLPSRNNNNNNLNVQNTNVKLVEDDLQKLSILPKYCPMYTQSFHNYFNDGATLKPVEPYKYTEEVNPKGGLQTKMEYNLFYSDMQLEPLQSPQTFKKHSSEYEDISGKTQYKHIPNSLLHRYTNDNTFSKHFAERKLNVKPDTKGFPGFDNYNQLLDYNNSALKNVKNLYSSVFEDMYIMSYKPEPKMDEIDKNIGYRFK